MPLSSRMTCPARFIHCLPNATRWRKKEDEEDPAGQYIGLAKAKRQTNQEKKQALESANWEKWDLKLSSEAILKRIRIRPEKIAEKAADDPTADFANRIKENQVQVLMKISGNLKGQCQRNLKIAASTMLDLLEILRTQADQTTK